MGLANLVPGVSGGTMLLAVGVYPQCIEAIAKVTALRPDRESAKLLASIATAAALIVLLLAGPVRTLVLDHRWAMYSVFLGSTLGGVPVLWRLIGRVGWRTGIGTAVGLAAMVATASGSSDQIATTGLQAPMLFLAGLGAFAAMLLPGLSGSYLLVLTGQYVPVLGAVDALKNALLGWEGSRGAAALDAAAVLLPFAAGCLAALIGMSRLIRTMLRRHRSLTLGFLLGLLAGAMVGLWPFADEAARLAFPNVAEGVAAMVLAAGGFAVTTGIARLAPTAADTITTPSQPNGA